MSGQKKEGRRKEKDGVIGPVGGRGVLGRNMWSNAASLFGSE